MDLYGLFEGLLLMYEEEIINIDLAAEKATSAATLTIDKAIDQLVNVTCQNLSNLQSFEPSFGKEVYRGQTIKSNVSYEVMQKAQVLAVEVEEVIQNHFIVEIERLSVFAITVDRIVKHLKTQSKNQEVTSAEVSLLAKLNFMYSRFWMPEEPSLDGLNSFSAFRVGLVASSIGWLPLCRIFEDFDFDSNESLKQIKNNNSVFFYINNKIKTQLSNSYTDRIKDLQTYVSFLFSHLKREIRFVLEEIQQLLILKK